MNDPAGSPTEIDPMFEVALRRATAEVAAVRSRAWKSMIATELRNE